MSSIASSGARWLLRTTIRPSNRLTSFNRIAAVPCSPMTSPSRSSPARTLTVTTFPNRSSSPLSKSVDSDSFGKTVSLDFESYQPADTKNTTKYPVDAIVVCHGLFGSKQNWRSLGRAMASRFGVPVYALDLRNHGTSPHIDSLAYTDMAQDVIEFIKSHNLSNVALIGHSLGGKVSMSAALSPTLPEGLVSHLISVDMSPARGPISKEFERYIDGMLEIETAGLKTRLEADTHLQTIEKDIGVRQFLLTNLIRTPPDAATWSWRVPVRSIQKNIEQIGDFPYDYPGCDGQSQRQERSWNGKTLFIKGSKSKYINRKNIPIGQAYFPRSQLVLMETGHWCQAEKPNEFIQVVEKFLTGNTQDQTQEALQIR